jgi:hypothetical protein
VKCWIKEKLDMTGTRRMKKKINIRCLKGRPAIASTHRSNQFETK